MKNKKSLNHYEQTIQQHRCQAHAITRSDGVRLSNVRGLIMKTVREQILGDIKQLTKIDIDILSVKSDDSGVLQTVREVHETVHQALNKLYDRLSQNM